AQGAVQGDTSRGIAGRGWRMRVYHSIDVRTPAVNEQVHSNFAGGISRASDLVTALVHYDQIVRLHQSFAHHRRRAKDVAALQTHRQVAVGGRYQTSLVQQFPEADNLVPMLLFRLHAV